MSVQLQKPSSNLVLYRDKKLATWGIQSQDVGGVTMPFWQAIGDGYGKKVTILAPSKEALIKKVEEYSAANKRTISSTESSVMVNYGTYGLLGGGALMAIGKFGGLDVVGKAGAAIAAVGFGVAASGKIFEPKKVEGGGVDQIVLDFGLGG